MSDFNATLTRAFAEEHHEPADDGFTFRVAEAVARKEKRAVWLLAVQGLGGAAAIAAVIWGLMAGFGSYGPAVMASLGLEVARAHGALTQVGSFNLATLAAGLMPQLLLITGALAGAGMVYRNSQQQ